MLFAGELPASLALLPQLVVLDVSRNALTGTLKEFAFATVANRADLYSTLRYFDISNNSFAGEHRFARSRQPCCMLWMSWSPPVSMAIPWAS